jgi:hypothetical protein
LIFRDHTDKLRNPRLRERREVSMRRSGEGGHYQRLGLSVCRSGSASKDGHEPVEIELVIVGQHCTVGIGRGNIVARCAARFGDWLEESGRLVEGAGIEGIGQVQ